MLRRRLVDLFTRRPEYQVTIPLGISGERQPLFRIQVVISTVLLRDSLLPQISTLAEVSGGALLVSLLVTMFATNRVLRPLKRIEGTIDRIVQGSYRGGVAQHAEAKEFAVVEGKL